MCQLDAKEKLALEDVAFEKFRVEFNGIKGDRVPGFLYRPKDAARKHPAILLQYGSGGHKNVNYIVALGQLYVKRGFVVLTIDVPGRGERKQKSEAKKLLPSLSISTDFDERWEQTLGDYSRAIDYLCSRPDVDSGRIAFIGISWGAITGITFVAHDQRVKVMASIVGGGNLLAWLPPLFANDMRRRVEAMDPVHHVALIAPRPLLLLNVTNDVLVPKFFAEELHKAAGEHAKKVWLETDHVFSTVDREDVGKTVIDFVVEGLAGQDACAQPR